MRSDHYEKFYPKEYLIEELCVIEETSGPYICVKWYVADPDPATDSYLTDDGSSPKEQFEHEGKHYMVSDTYWLGAN